jgi:hypothetical protein
LADLPDYSDRPSRRYGFCWQAGIVWELPLGMRQIATDLYYETTKHRCPGAMSETAPWSDPRNQFNPLHPDETSVSVPCPSGF